jgi:phosphate acyltransferase
MSGDLGPRVAMLAAQKFAVLYNDVDLLVVGDEPQLLNLISANKASQNQISIVHAPDLVTMDDDPVVALRHRQSSSMWRAVESVKNDLADACVSAGNTGALLAISKHLIKTFPSIDRPAICKALPTAKDTTYFLDLGANINCTAENLHQFALMGQVLAMSSGAIKPRIGLLNIGTEKSKGTDIIQAAQSFLQDDARLNYGGFVEASELFSGNFSVIVCDGFHGNIALKSSEGTAHFIAEKVRRLLTKNWRSKLIGVFIAPLLKQLRSELDPSRHNGASFLGLQKTIVKSHGNANEKAFLEALVVAREQVLQQIPTRIQQQFLNN